MKLGSLAGNVCRICGSETMGSDIGCSCKKLYDKAVFIALKNHDDDSLAYNFSIEMKYYMEKFISQYDGLYQRHNGNINKMYRTEFNRTFYPSVYKFFKENGYVSKKQLDIVKRLLGKDFDFAEKDYEEIQKQKKNYLADFSSRNDSEIVEITRNLWKQKKGENR